MARRPSPIVKRSVTISGHSTSISIERPFWAALQEVAKAQGLSLAALLRRIDAGRAAHGEVQANLSSTVRVFVLEWLADKAGVPLEK